MIIATVDISFIDPFFWRAILFFHRRVASRNQSAGFITSCFVAHQAVPTSLSLLQVPFMADEVWIGVLALP